MLPPKDLSLLALLAQRGDAVNPSDVDLSSLNLTSETKAIAKRLLTNENGVNDEVGRAAKAMRDWAKGISPLETQCRRK